jgi:SMC interacting uncharacterized protein involved in chromosome segregation
MSRGQAREQNLAQRAEIEKLRREVGQLRADQTSLAKLEGRLDRLEARERAPRRASDHTAAKPKKTVQTEVARLSHP